MSSCKIVSVGKRRDGGTKYWCLQHRADATAKYGLKAKQCRYAHVPPVGIKEKIIIDVKEFPGGIALWGAVPPVYDTTTLPLDRGIHVHARYKKNGKKIIDKTFREVRLKSDAKIWTVTELDAIYYMVSKVSGYSLKEIQCSHCACSHLDKDWFSIHPHQSHLCSGCGRSFRDNEISIGNPAVSLSAIPGAREPVVKPAKKPLRIRQKDFPGGIQFWGSNPSILWTSKSHQESGIHVHAFKLNGAEPVIDDTFVRVEIDGIALEERQVRTYMVQNTLPHLFGRITAIKCGVCGSIQEDLGDNAINPKVKRVCSSCGATCAAHGRIKKVISNPLVTALENMATRSVQSPRLHDLGLLPETL